MEQNSEWDAKLAQHRIEMYNREVRERHIQKQKRRQDKQERMRRVHEEGITQEKQPGADESEESDSTRDIYEKIQMKKINKKFSQLMSFDIEKTFNNTQTLLNRH